MTQNKNYGLNLNKEISEITAEDWLFGIKDVSGLAEDIDFEKYLPIGEVQRGKEDTSDCATRAPINILETKLTYLYQNNLLHPLNRKWLEDNGYIQDNRVVLADAFNAMLSGTTRLGNSLKAPIESIRKDGVIPKQLLPLEKWMRWADYHNKNRITPKILQLGQDFLERFTINYQRVLQTDFYHIIKYDIIDIAGYAWPRPNSDGIYPRTTNTPNHVFVYFKTPPYHIFDNYHDSFDGDFIKHLASDYFLYYYGYRLIVNENNPKKKLMTSKDLENLYKLGLFREPDDSAQTHLKYNWDLVAKAIANSPEHSVYERAINFLRSSGLIKFFDQDSILGRIFGKK